MLLELTAHDLQLHPEAACAHLGEALDALADDGHLLTATNQDGDDRRIPVARTYLWLLGYLKYDNENDRYDEEFTLALAAFCAEANLASANWLTDTIWERLQYYCAFDNSIYIDELLGKDFHHDLLRRVVHLRLFSYGFLNRPPASIESGGNKGMRYEKTLQSALDDFVRVCAFFKFHADPLQATLNPELLQILLNHEQMLQQLPLQGDGVIVFAAHPDLPLKEVKAKMLRKAFLANLALVELWLLGYGVRPGNFKPDGPQGRDGDDTLFHALDRFARDRSLDAGNTHELRAWFFVEARKLQRGEDSNEIAEQALVADLDIVMNEKAQRRNLEKQYKSLGARIFEGIRRVVNWLRDRIKGAIKNVKQWIRNLARVLHRLGGRIYTHLAAMIEVVRIGFNYVMRSPVPGSDPNGVYLAKRLDFDLVQIIHTRASTVAIETFHYALAWQVRAVSLGGSIIAQLWRLIRMVLDTTGLPVNWLGMLSVLVKFSAWLRNSIELAREAQALVSTAHH